MKTTKMIKDSKFVHIKYLRRARTEKAKNLRVSGGDLFGLSYVMFNNSSKMWFLKKDLVTFFGINDEEFSEKLEETNIVVEVLRFESQETMKSFNASVKEMGLNIKVMKFFDDLYCLEAVFLCLYAMGINNKPIVLMRKYFNQNFSDMLYDGFASLYGWNCSKECRRAIASHILGVEHYKEILKKRFNPSHHSFGSICYNIEQISGNESNPDMYITRDELSEIKKVDQAIGQLQDVFDLPEKDLLNFLGIKFESGIMSLQDENELRQYVKERLHAIS